MQRNGPLVSKLLFLGFSHGLKWRGRDGIRKSVRVREGEGCREGREMRDIIWKGAK